MNNLSACADFFNNLEIHLDGNIYYDDTSKLMRFETRYEYSIVDIHIKDKLKRAILSLIKNNLPKNIKYFSNIIYLSFNYTHNSYMLDVDYYDGYMLDVDYYDGYIMNTEEILLPKDLSDELISYFIKSMIKDLKNNVKNIEKSWGNK